MAADLKRGKTHQLQGGELSVRYDTIRCYLAAKPIIIGCTRAARIPYPLPAPLESIKGRAKKTRTIHLQEDKEPRIINDNQDDGNYVQIHGYVSRLLFYRRVRKKRGRVACLLREKLTPNKLWTVRFVDDVDPWLLIKLLGNAHTRLGNVSLLVIIVVLLS